MTNIGERLFRALLHAYPRTFRERYSKELISFFREEQRHSRYGTGPLRVVRFWTSTLRDLSRVAAAERLPGSITAPVGFAPRRALSALAFDLRQALRSLRSTPAVTLTALSVLALGLGAGATIFSVVDAVVLRELPFAGEDRLVAVNETELASGRPGAVAYPNFAEWVQRQDVFDQMAASANGPWLRTTGERPERFRSYRITANLFGLIGAHPVLGRAFSADEETAGAKVALISDEMWRRRFNRDPSVVGKAVAFEEGTVSIIGVMPRGFKYPVGSIAISAIDLWVPLTPGTNERIRTQGRNYNLRVIARLKPGVSIEQASARMAQIRDGMAPQFPDWFHDRGVVVRPIRDSVVVSSVRTWMLMLLGAVTAVFLAACANVANLLLARAAGRSREIGIRSAMGATRWHIVRGLVVESVALAVTGSLLGLLLAYWGVDVLRATLPPTLPRVWSVGVDLRVAAVAVAAAVASGLLCGLIPALQLSGCDVSAALRSSGRSSTDTRARQRVRAAVLAAEVALAAVLLVGAGTFGLSFWRVVTTELGFESNGNVLSVGVSPAFPSDRALFEQARRRFEASMEPVLERVRVLPGIQSAALVAGGAPLTGSYSTHSVEARGRRFTDDDEVVLKQVTAEYFETVGARVLRGRPLTAQDTKGSFPVVVLNDEAAKRYLGDGDPLGARISIEGLPPRTVVGVVRGMRLRGPETEIAPEAYVPYAQSSNHNVSASLVVRAHEDAVNLIPSIKNAIWEVMPNVEIPEPQTFEKMFGALIVQRRLNMTLLAIFGGLALLIASIGIYGMLSYLVEQRTREIGVRMALGAVPGAILRMVLGRAGVTIVVGIAGGFLASMWLERLVMAFVYRGKPQDPVVYASAAAVIVLLGLAAAAIPAYKAAKVDPLVALRAE